MIKFTTFYWLKLLKKLVIELTHEVESEITGSLGLSDACPRLYLVPRVLASHTSNPLSAKRKAKDWSGGNSSHVIPSCHHTITCYIDKNINSINESCEETDHSRNNYQPSRGHAATKLAAYFLESSLNAPLEFSAY